MNKILMISCGVLMMSSVAMADETAAETCANGAGTVVIGSVTGHKYCKSNKAMNWWNAHAWCDGQNRRLVDKSDCACSDITADCANNICSELKKGGGSWSWIANPSGASRAHLVNLTSGTIASNDRNTSFDPALCY